MPKESNEENWQYKARMVGLAHRIMKHVETAGESHEPVWHFREVAAALDVPEEDVRVACTTAYFTYDCHVRDGCFFLKTLAERLDDLSWTLSTGRFAQ